MDIWHCIMNIWHIYYVHEHIHLIWHSISSSCMDMLWNSVCIGDFNPSTGVRQGYPLSPYLFVICMERLSHLIFLAVEQGRWNQFFYHEVVLSFLIFILYMIFSYLLKHSWSMCQSLEPICMSFVLVQERKWV